MKANLASNSVAITAENTEVMNLIRQVSHDIRSPLSSLNLVSSLLHEVSEEKRILIRHSVQRINDIANELLGKYRNFEISTITRLAPEQIRPTEAILLPALVDVIISEKRLQFRHLINAHIEAHLTYAQSAFINTNAGELQRVISNLINNAVEALENGEGEVLVSVREQANKLLISIKDNGCGMAPEILQRIGTPGFSFGKKGQSGNGLGLAHARRTLEAFGSELRIQSELGVGTTVEFQLEKAETPDWFLPQLNLPVSTTICCLDDDISIHDLWKQRLLDLEAETFGVQLVSFQRTEDLRHFIQSKNDLGNILYLIDSDLGRENCSGLEIIEELNLSAKAILVTSHHDDRKLQQDCGALGVKILPKFLAGFIKIEITGPKIADFSQKLQELMTGPEAQTINKFMQLLECNDIHLSEIIQRRNNTQVYQQTKSIDSLEDCVIHLFRNLDSIGKQTQLSSLAWANRISTSANLPYGVKAILKRELNLI